MPKISIINGPNLNLLGVREPGHYGSSSLTQINEKLLKIADQKSIELDCFQSNSESELIEFVHRCYQKVDFIIINPAAFTHTSIALRDALSAIKIPFVEIHLSNIHSREDFRKISYFSDLAEGVISGLGSKGYELALEYAIEYLEHL